jgi:hypothetical protein
VQTDLRNRLYASPVHNARLVRRGHSATLRLGELYEESLYARVPDGRGNRARLLDHLLIEPADTPEGSFEPSRQNAARRNKVPILYLNAVTLNTGHTWQYTASWQGEPPAGVDTEVDANERLRRLYHDQLPEGAPPACLGTAVAASSCVPGGVRDNQGIGALFENDCQIVLVSDATGQLPAVPITQRSRLGVPLRSSSVMGHSLRGAQHREVEARTANGMLRNSLWVHLKSGLSGRSVRWIDMPEPEAPPSGGSTPHGIASGVQRRLADLRTDLDAFTDIEANCLMYSGYATVDHALREESWADILDACEPATTDWSFLIVKDAISDEPENAHTRHEIERQLDIGSRLFGKAGQLVPWLRFAGVALGVVLVVFLLAIGVWTRQAHLLTGRFVFVLLAVLTVVAIVGRFVSLDWLRRYAIATGMATVGWIPFRLYLWVALPRLLDAGRLPSPSRPERRATRTTDPSSEQQAP